MDFCNHYDKANLLNIKNNLVLCKHQQSSVTYNNIENSELVQIKDTIHKG